MVCTQVYIHREIYTPRNADNVMASLYLNSCFISNDVTIYDVATRIYVSFGQFLYIFQNKNIFSKLKYV